MKASGPVDPSQSRVSSSPVKERIHRSTQEISEESASSRTASTGVHHTLAGIHASRDLTNVQAPVLGKLTRLKSLEQALTEEIQEERVAAEGGAADLTAVPTSSLFSRLKERLAAAKDELHQKLSPMYRGQIRAATECLHQAQNGPSAGYVFDLPLLNLIHGEPDAQVQRLQKSNVSLRPNSPVLYLDRIQLRDGGYSVIGIQSMREATKKDSASGPCLCIKGDGKRVIFMREGQRMKSSQERDQLVEEFQRSLQERRVEVPTPKREIAAQQAISGPQTSLAKEVATADLSHLPPQFLEDVQRIAQNVGSLTFHNLERRLRLGGLERAMDEVYATFQEQGMDDSLRQVASSPLAKTGYQSALNSLLMTQADALEMTIQKNNTRTPFLGVEQLSEAVDRPVVFQLIGNSTKENEETNSTRRIALKLKPESYGDAAELTTRLLREYPDMLDAVKLFPPRQSYSRQDNLVIYLKKDAPSARSEQFQRLTEALSNADICRKVTERERIPGMQQLGAQGIYYVENPPLASAEDSIADAMPPFNAMGSQAPGGSHGRFMALVVIASNMLAAREQIPLNEAVQKVWQFAWSVPSRDVTTPQSRQ